MKVYQNRQNHSFKLKLTGFDKNNRSRIIEEVRNTTNLSINNCEILIKKLPAVLLKDK